MAEPIPIPPPPPESWVLEYLRRNPRATRATALNDASLLVSRDTGQPSQVILKEWLSQQPGFLERMGRRLTWEESPLNPRVLERDVYQPVAGVAREGVDLALRGFGIVPPNPLASALSTVAVPRTLPGAAMMAAAGPVARIGTGTVGLGRNLLNPLLRVGTMGGVGAASEGAVGRSPQSGFAEGVTSQAFGEMMRGVINVYRSTKHIQSYKTMLRQADADASDTLRGLEASMPELTPLAAARPGERAADTLMRLRHTIDDFASDLYQKSDEMVTTVLGGPKAMVPVPSLSPGPLALPPSMSVEDFLGKLKDARRMARVEARRPTGTQDFAVMEAATRLGDDLLAALSRVDPRHAIARGEVDRMYRQARSVSGLLHKSGAFETNLKRGTGAVFEGAKAREYLLEHDTEMSPYGPFAPLWQALLQGARPGAEHVIGLAPRVRGYFGQGVSMTTPNIRFVRAPLGGWGVEPLNPLVPVTAGGAASAISGHTVE